MTDPMILYARFVTGNKHLKRWYHKFGSIDMLGEHAVTGWSCIICGENWIREYTPDPRLQGKLPNPLSSLYYSALAHHKEAHSRDALDLEDASLHEQEGPSKPAASDVSPASADKLAHGSERGQPQAGDSVQEDAHPPSQGSPATCLHDTVYEPDGLGLKKRRG